MSIPLFGKVHNGKRYSLLSKYKDDASDTEGAVAVSSAVERDKSTSYFGKLHDGKRYSRLPKAEDEASDTEGAVKVLGVEPDKSTSE